MPFPPSTDASCLAAVIPVHNRAATIERAIRSVLTQTVVPATIIVVDDGSTDDTARTVRRLSIEDPRVRLIRRKHNGGPAAARNTGVRRAPAHCQWIAFLDSDDEWYPEKTQRTLEALQHRTQHALPTPGCIYTAHYEIGSTDQHLRLPPKAGGETYSDLLDDFYVIPSTAMVFRKAYGEVGGMDPTMRTWEDHDFFLKLARQWPIQAIRQPLANRHTSTSERQTLHLRHADRFHRRWNAEIRRHHGRAGLGRFLLRTGHVHATAGLPAKALLYSLRGLMMAPRNWRTARLVIHRSLATIAGIHPLQPPPNETLSP